MLGAGAQLRVQRPAARRPFRMAARADGGKVKMIRCPVALLYQQPLAMRCTHSHRGSLDVQWCCTLF